MELPLQIDKQSGVPLNVQMEQQIRLLIRRGLLKPGDLMPTVRTLAVSLEINSNTVARVYRDLQHSGVLLLKRGIGTFVAENMPPSCGKPVDLESFEPKVAELIAAARQRHLSCVELLQLIEVRWKEISNAHG